VTVRYPLWLDLDRRRVVVIGGGAVAARRIIGLLDAGAAVTVVAPSPVEEISADARVTILRARYDDSHLADAALVLACTDDPAVNERVAADAAARGLWCVRADDAEASPAWTSAVARVDDVAISVSGGADPGRATSIRNAVEALLRAGELSTRASRRQGNAGSVVLVGGGPGDPDLLTLRGWRALLDADVVVHDRLSPGGVLGRLPEGIRVVDVGKSPGGGSPSQADINRLIVEAAASGQRVVRLKGGDPFVFGRGSEELHACVAAGVAVEVVPGLSSATAAAALSGVPLTERGTTQLFTVASGHLPPGDPASTVDWAALALTGGTLVLLMAVANLARIAEELLAHGRPGDTPVAAIENASLPAQRVVRTTLAELGGGHGPSVHSPAVVVIGEVAAVRPDGAGVRPS
jgi:uroporphyrin-III C-methyltransferase/precorrin-2 dehydrogenase/sirohydrochlorin ferrochelatase